jgi:hypothetical protein
LRASARIAGSASASGQLGESEPAPAQRGGHHERQAELGVVLVARSPFRLGRLADDLAGHRVDRAADRRDVLGAQPVLGAQVQHRVGERVDEVADRVRLDGGAHQLPGLPEAVADRGRVGLPAGWNPPAPPMPTRADTSTPSTYAATVADRDSWAVRVTVDSSWPVVDRGAATTL